jgi:hypothetical protein
MSGVLIPEPNVHPSEAAVTGLQDHLSTFADQSQDALAGAARAWAESVQRLSSPFGTPAADPAAMVDLVFDLAEQVLATQRALTKAVLRAVTP